MEPTNDLSCEQIRDFVIAAHGNLPRVREMLTEYPELLNAKWQWAENDSETAIQAAAQVGSAQVAEYLLERGTPLEICTAAMLGRTGDVRRMLDEAPDLIRARGAHGITLMAHAALSNDVELAQVLYDRGARDGMSHALGNAFMHGDARMARWILENGHPDLAWKNYEGKSLMTIAVETGKAEMLALLHEYGAT